MQWLGARGFVDEAQRAQWPPSIRFQQLRLPHHEHILAYTYSTQQLPVREARISRQPKLQSSRRLPCLLLRQVIGYDYLRQGRRKFIG